jgi:hypothetical protein
MQPTVIQGPAIIKRGALVVYCEDDVVIDYNVETWNPSSSHFGKMGERLKSRNIVVKGKPCGEVKAATFALWPYTPADIGKSILAATALEVIPLTGNKYTFARSGLLKAPSLHLSPTNTAWSDEVQFLCLGDPAKEPTDAAYFQVLAATAANTDYDETKVISPRYNVAWGLAPYDAIETEDGVQVTPIIDVKPGPYTANYGQLDASLTSLGVSAAFTPTSLSEANYFGLIALQGASALRPGDIIGRTNDLVISGTGLSLTLSKMGAAQGQARFATAVWRFGSVVMHNRITTAAGVANPVWTFA